MIGPDAKVPYESFGYGTGDICQYKITADESLDSFSLKIGSKESKAQYTLFSQDDEFNLKKIGSFYQGEIRAYSKFNKNFILLVLPKEENSKVDFQIESGRKKNNVERETHVFLLVFAILFSIWLCAVAGFLIYYFFFRNRGKYLPQIDSDDTYDGSLTGRSQRQVPDNFYTIRDEFSKLID